ncbi:MAG: methylated-DNA--[protein]-cysteine S-methyltransferase [Opitutaceae bacterium]|nr:methylated-DNA--[protein]-cysteine S-methyltransferase [Opitutaceae bacterium]
MKYSYDTFETPLGLFSIAVNGTGELVAAAFGDKTALQARLRPCHVMHDPIDLPEARSQIAEYFAGEPSSFDLPLAPAGTPFQQQVRAAVQGIPCGETRSYAELGAQVGRPSAARAVGRANATNPICLIVPCHRVIGHDGSLTGYAFGKELKRRLLALEEAMQPA